MSFSRAFSSGVLVLVVVSMLAACSASEAEPGTDSTTVECKSAFNKAGVEQARLYDTHPFYSDEYFELSLDEQDAIRLDEEQQWSAIIEPIYSSCSGPADFFYSGVSLPAVFGITSFEGRDLAEEAGYILPSFCADREETLACDGWQEFLAGL